MGMLETGTAHLTTMLDAHTSIAIVYSRSGVSVSCNATRGSTPFEASDAEGIIHRTARRDYLISADQFPFTEHPREGDSITDAGDRYAVQSIPGEPVWSWVDGAKTLMRIHTKKQ
jgi:hypothetical protein